MSEHDIELGYRVKDPITGFQGVVVGMSTWITGCDRAAIRAEADDSADRPDLYYIDAPALEIIGKDTTVRSHFEGKGLINTQKGGPGKSIPK